MRHVGISGLKNKAVMVSIGLFGGENLPYDADAYKFILAVGITDLKQQAAVNELVIALKAGNFWNYIGFWFPIAGTTAEQHRYELKTATKRVTWNGMLIHDYTGVEGAGGYGATDFIPSAAGLTNAIAVGRRSVSLGQAQYVDMGVVDVTGVGSYILLSQQAPGINNTVYVGISEGASIVHVVMPSTVVGFAIASGDGSTGYFISSPPSYSISFTDSIKAWSAYPVYLLAENNDNTGPYFTSGAKYTTFFLLKRYLTPAEGSVLNTIIEDFERAYRIDSYQFMRRVLADGGTFESRASLDNKLLSLEPYLLRFSYLMLPYAFKEQKIYAIIPASGDGDLVFDRLDITQPKKLVTRVNQDGLVERFPYNLFVESQAFNADNANQDFAWAKVDVTITPNYQIAPDGTLTADLLLETNTVNVHVVKQRIYLFRLYKTYSLTVYVKTGNNRDWIWLAVDDGNNTVRQWYNIAGQTVGSALNSGIGFSTDSTAIERANNGFLKVTLIFTSLSDSLLAMDITMGVANADLSFSYQGDVTRGMTFWGAQLSELTSKSYLATTTRNNIPRIDYLNSYPELLIEPARTNFIPFSEDFNDAIWGKFLLTITPNVDASPDSSSNATKIAEDTTDGIHMIRITNSETNTRSETFSIFLKAVESNWVILFINDGTIYKGTYFNIATGVMGSPFSTGASSIITMIRSSIEDYGLGWYRCSISYTLTSPLSTTYRGMIMTTGDGGPRSYPGDGFSGFYAWGAQYEKTSYLTSYISVSGADGIMNRDFPQAKSMQALIGQTEGVIYYEFNLPVDIVQQQNLVEIAKDVNNTILLYLTVNRNIAVYTVTNSVTENLVASSVVVGVGITYKAALLYKAGRIALFVNGVKQLDLPTYTLPSSFTNFSIASILVRVAEVGLFPAVLTDAECVTLTTVPFEPEYKAILDYATSQGYTLPNTANQTAQNNLLRSMKADGSWSNYTIFYNFTTNGDRNFAKINWKNPGTFNCVENGALTFTSMVGFKGDGATGYLNTQWVPTWTLVNSGFITSVVNSVAGATEFPVLWGNYDGVSYNQFCPFRVSAAHIVFSFHSTNANIPIGGVNGFYHGLYLGQFELYKNGNLIHASFDLPNGDPPLAIYVLARNFSGVADVFSDHTCAMIGFGSANADNKISMHTSWNNYLAAMNIVNNLSDPTINDNPTVGSLINLSSDGNWDLAITIDYQWLRDGVDIIGEVGASYTLTAADIGSFVSCKITASNADSSRFIETNRIGPIV